MNTLGVWDCWQDSWVLFISSEGGPSRGATERSLAGPGAVGLRDYLISPELEGALDSTHRQAPSVSLKLSIIWQWSGRYPGGDCASVSLRTQFPQVSCSITCPEGVLFLCCSPPMSTVGVACTWILEISCPPMLFLWSCKHQTLGHVTAGHFRFLFHSSTQTCIPLHSLLPSLLNQVLVHICV